MIRIEMSARVEAPVTDTWAWLARLDQLPLWAEAVLTARCRPGLEHGVGAVRVCTLKGGLAVVETWTAWEEGRSFTYEGTGLPMVARARNTWTVEPCDENRSIVRSVAAVQMRGGPFGQLLAPAVRWQSRRMGWRTLAAFKHLVEHGEPAQVAHAALARPLTYC